ncbi:phosphate transport system permease protein PstA [Aureimonas sp. SA4125]|uniref:phosphate ABC transporter permease PstA n=1 Tax=Aureimonas sp. SA4125 TaxID=2826993 RepID=UPI001CC60AA0|nr:phosphate ABC transporter permease PstA [Aureimonas sp. SA4125]BDA83559.1 phosphate transport system permease protein PstA [Aureimonas sp. SA4125]
MTDIPLTDRLATPTARETTRSRIRAGLAGRKSAQRRLKIYGIAAIVFALTMLGVLVSSVISTSLPAWTQTQILLDITVPEGGPGAPTANYGTVVDNAVAALFPAAERDRAELRRLTSMLSNGAQYWIRDAMAATSAAPGTVVPIWVPVSDAYEQLYEGIILASTPENRRPLNDGQIDRFEELQQQDRVRSVLDWGLINNADSRFPELAGLRGGLVGTFYLLIVCLCVSVPIGVGAAVYLEEYAPKNKFTDFIEINVNNLAAVPSIVFGLLGLALFLGFFGMPRSAPLVGGLVLAIMTLPTIIITTRNALKAVPPSIREAARGIGASEMQVIGHHVLPLALPGIMTGVIIGLAQALGETAPLLLIGMNAFITSAPDSMLEASTTLPTQIFIWFDSPERGFVARTSAAICVLLVVLSFMNIIAIILRRRFERRW